MKRTLVFLLAVVTLLFTTACNEKGTAKSVKGLEMVKVPGATYKTVYHQILHGDTPIYFNLKPSDVTLADFEIGKTEITYQTWYDVYKWATDEARGDKRYRFTNSGREGNAGIDGAEPTNNKNHPVTSISWFNAVIWCNALSEKAGLEPVYYFDGNVARDVRKIEELDVNIFEYTWPWNTYDEDAIKRNKEKFPNGYFEEDSFEDYYGSKDRISGGKLEPDSNGGDISERNRQPLIDLLEGEACELQKHFKIDASKNGFRLPTCLEWVYAAKGGKPGSYEWDMKYSGSDTASEVGWFRSECGYDTNIKKMNKFLPEYGTKNVATKKPNGLGIYDMSGNVGEMTQSFRMDIYNSNGMDANLRTYWAASGWNGNNSELPEDSTLSMIKLDDTKGNVVGFRVARNAQ